MIAVDQTNSRRMSPPICLPTVDGQAPAVHGYPERELHAATTAGLLVLHYQPRLCLTTGKIVANEVSVRSPRCKQGLTPPDGFIAVAERSDSIDLIGTWVLAEACREAASWNIARLSVNVSARQFQSGVLPFQVAAALEQSGLPPDRLELRLTESSLASSNTDTLLALAAIRDQGIGLALDGFGAGFADLSKLKRLPLSTVKLDRSVVRELPTNREGAAIICAVIRTSRAMGLTTVAEGIETEAQRALLSGLGCDEGQGELFSHPLPAGQLRPMLDAARC